MIVEQVNIYTYSGIKGLKRQSGMVGYVLSLKTEEKEYTIEDFLQVENVTENQSELKVLVEAMKRMKRPCELCIYTDSLYVSSAVENGWLDRWRTQGWHNSKEKEIANIELWQELDILLAKHKYRFETRTKHEYRDWLRSEIRRKQHV